MTTISGAICSAHCPSSPAIALESAELALDHLHSAVIVLDDGARRDFGLVYIQRNDAPMHRFQLHPWLLQVLLSHTLERAGQHECRRPTACRA